LEVNRAIDQSLRLQKLSNSTVDTKGRIKNIINEASVDELVRER
jgi:hypothetical protein